MTPLAKQLRACKTHKERLKLLEDHSPGANLCGANLSGMDLHDGNFVCANFDQAYLRDNNFRGANFEGADFDGADLLDNDFRWANFDGAYFCKYGHLAVVFTDDDTVQIGCKTKPSIAEWDELFAGDEEFETPRDTPEFEEIRKNWEWAKDVWRRSK